MLKSLQTSKSGWDKGELQHLFLKRERGYARMIISMFLRVNFGWLIDLMILKKPICRFRNSAKSKIGYFLEVIRASCIDKSQTRRSLYYTNSSLYPLETSNK